ncbi:MAG: FAD-binding oxidoreductase [Rhodospirillaceae bacterium]|nr:FAD-binding oxidoreductase [Rhodospirillaceae bacterium]
MATAISPHLTRKVADRLIHNIEGDVLFDAFTLGRYSTDASIYQITPIGVVIPKTMHDLVTAVEIALDANIPLLPRGAGTSQCGQTVNEAIVIDCSQYLNQIIDFDPSKKKVTVEPGVVLDHLNSYLKSYDLFFPVDISTASRATIGGMTANNSCGARSIQYGIMVDNVHSIEAIMPSGEHAWFSDTPMDLGKLNAPKPYVELVDLVREIAAREKSQLETYFPKLKRRVGGYNLDTVDPNGHNMAKLLIGSEGTLSTFKKIELKLQNVPRHRVMGVCQFPTFYSAMDATQHLVRLKPSAVELIDRTMIDLARDIPIFRPIVESFVKGEPDAVLLVEFSGEMIEPLKEKLKELAILMSDLGHPNAIIEAVDPAFQARITAVRQQGLNIMMSMKTAGKPVSFIEDCAVPLQDLAEYTDRLTQIFKKYGTNGTWYAHASVGCLHVRPILDMKKGGDIRKMRAIAEEAFAMVREYKGSHSGEHGDGIVRSEFHREMYGDRLVDAFGEVKKAFDPKGLMNPGRIVEPPKMDDRSLFRYKPDYKTVEFKTAMDWSEWQGISGAVEMCNNNGACRNLSGDVMCPSYRVTKNEKHVTRGRANTLRLALSGQLGPDALSNKDMVETMDLCVSCKACRRECPTGVDMARMKIESKYARIQKYGLSARDRIVGSLPKYVEIASRFHFISNLRDQLPLMPWLSDRLFGFSRKRPLPIWNRRPFRVCEASVQPREKNVVLLMDTFNTYFEPQNLRAALNVLETNGYRVHLVGPGSNNDRPLCCGRSYLSVGMVEAAREELKAMQQAFIPFIEKGMKIVGLEPSCLNTLRDEALALHLGTDAERLAESSMMFEEFLIQEINEDRLNLELVPVAKNVLVHGHCHQKAFGGMEDVDKILGLIPELEVELINSSCCGMAGAFGYESEHYEMSMNMGELDLLPRVRGADKETIIVADGTSCRHQIYDGAGRRPFHVAQLLEMAHG